jgi:hypothetical protein
MSNDAEIVKWLSMAMPIAKGDVEGHEFHGNQWTTAEGVKAGIQAIADKIDEAYDAPRGEACVKALDEAIKMCKAGDAKPNRDDVAEHLMGRPNNKDGIASSLQKLKTAAEKGYPIGFVGVRGAPASDAAIGVPSKQEIDDLISKVKGHDVITTKESGRVILPLNGYTKDLSSNISRLSETQGDIAKLEAMSDEEFDKNPEHFIDKYPDEDEHEHEDFEQTREDTLGVAESREQKIKDQIRLTARSIDSYARYPQSVKSFSSGDFRSLQKTAETIIKNLDNPDALKENLAKVAIATKKIMGDQTLENKYVQQAHDFNRTNRALSTKFEQAARHYNALPRDESSIPIRSSILRGVESDCRQRINEINEVRENYLKEITQPKPYGTPSYAASGDTLSELEGAKKAFADIADRAQRQNEIITNPAGNRGPWFPMLQFDDRWLTSRGNALSIGLWGRFVSFPTVSSEAFLPHVSAKEVDERVAPYYKGKYGEVARFL